MMLGDLVKVLHKEYDDGLLPIADVDVPQQSEARHRYYGRIGIIVAIKSGAPHVITNWYTVSIGNDMVEYAKEELELISEAKK